MLRYIEKSKCKINRRKVYKNSGEVFKKMKFIGGD